MFHNFWIRKNNIYDLDALSSGPQPYLNSSSKPQKQEIMKKGHNFDLWEEIKVVVRNKTTSEISQVILAY